MHASEKKLELFSGKKLLRLAGSALAVTVAVSTAALAQAPGQKTYASPEEASNALFAAAQKNDQTAMLEVLGKDGKSVIESGDPKEDDAMRANFVEKFQVMHRLVEEPDATTTLYIGAENWPTPIPLVNRAGKWYFDTDAAKKEILFRRIGKNELSAIRVCEELVAAQKELFSKNNEYAAKFVSDDGKQNGLYWPANKTANQSPIGPLVANAGSLGGLTMDSGADPFRGYYFRLLDRQGKQASGGVMTFIVAQDGTVYERDFGKQTVQKAKALKAYDPDQNWKRSEELPQQSAANEKPQKNVTRLICRVAKPITLRQNEHSRLKSAALT